MSAFLCGVLSFVDTGLAIGQPPPPPPPHYAFLYGVVFSYESTGKTLLLPYPNYVFSGFRWRRRPPDMEGSCDTFEKAVADSRYWVVLQVWGLGEGLIIIVRHRKYLVTKCRKSGLTVMKLRVP